MFFFLYLCHIEILSDSNLFKCLIAIKCSDSQVRHSRFFFIICEENRNNTDNVVYNKMINFWIKWSVEDLLKHLKALSLATDKIQEKSCATAATFHIWKVLEKYLMEEKLVKMCAKIFSTTNQTLGFTTFYRLPYGSTLYWN